MRLYLHQTNCSELTNWFLRLQLMRISNWKNSHNAMSIKSPDGTRPSQEGEYYLAEQLLIALYSVPDDRTYERTYYQRAVQCTRWTTDAKEGITRVQKHGNVCYYIVGAFRWNGTLYDVTAEISNDARGRTPKFLMWLGDPSWDWIGWEKGYDPVLPTGKNAERDAIIGVTFTENFWKEDYSRVSFEGCTFKDMLFIDTTLSGATFRNCTFENVAFVDVNARFTVIEHCSFDRVNLRESVWTGTSWHDCHYVSPLSMEKRPVAFDYEFYEECRDAGIMVSTGGTGDYNHCLPGMFETHMFYRPQQDGDYLLPIHDERFTYVPIDGAYMLVGDHRLSDGTMRPTNQMLWDAYRISRRAADNPLGNSLRRVW